ncbi:MAG: ABC transporter permease [Bacteroidota bacterium]
MLRLIYKREFLNLVRKKSFWLSTFLVPLLMAGVFGVQIFAGLNISQDDYIVLVPETDLPEITRYLESHENYTYKLSPLPIDSLKKQIWADDHLILMEIGPQIIEKPTGHATLYNVSSLNLSVVNAIRDHLRDAIRQYKQQDAGISRDQLAALDFDFSVDSVVSSPKEEKRGSEVIAMIVGLVISLLMYVLVAAYGGILMQGVIEEKTNRIVEVMISSVKPFKLLMGKVLAIASAGLLQFLLWTITSYLFVFILGLFAAGMIDPEQIMATQGPGTPLEAELAQGGMEKMLGQVENFQWGTLLWAFPIYFLGGFFLYGSLFAAAGASVDNIQDAQQLTLPISLPLLIPTILVMNIVQSPNSALAVTLSMIPFTSPMSMLVRLSTTEVPSWQVLVSITLLIMGFLGCIWLGSKIYRTGILMYGKKPSFKELWRWVRY